MTCDALTVALVTAIAPAAPEPLTLEQAVSLALERNESGRAAAERARAAAARVERARSFFFPELALTGTYTRRLREVERQVGGRTATIQALHAVNGAVGATLTLFDARAFPLLDQAQLERDAALLDAAEEQRQVAFRAAQGFLGVLGADQVLAAAMSRVELARRNFGDAEGRVSAGLVSSNDATRARLELASAERELTRAAQEAAVGRLELALVIDAPVEALAEPAGLLEQAARVAVPADPDETARRLDVVAAARRAESLEAAAREPWRRALPRFDVVGQYRATNETGFSGERYDGFAGVQATWVLWDGGERSAEGDERHALAAAGSLDARALARRAASEVQQARLLLESGRDVMRQAETAVVVARRNIEETTALYRQGLTTALTVADASVGLFEAEVDLARARYGVALALLALRQARGLDPLGREPG